MQNTKVFYRVILWLTAIAAAWGSFSLIDSFDAGKWQYLDFPVNEPAMLFVGLSWTVAIVGAMFVTAWMKKKGVGIGLISLFAALIGTGVMALATALPMYVFSTEITLKTAAGFWSLFQRVSPSFLMTGVILALYSVAIGVTLGTKALDPSPGGDLNDGPSSPTPSVDIRTWRSRLSRFFGLTRLQRQTVGSTA